MKRGFWIPFTVFAVASPVASQSSRVPKAQLRVAVQQREDGKLDKGVHLLELICFDGCFLTSVSLNQCRSLFAGQEPSFTPVVQRSSTREGNLRVRAERNTLIVEETGSDLGGTYTNSFRFGYRPDPDFVHELTSFSGGFVKQSDLLKKAITVEYVPLRQREQVLKLDCGVSLPGVER